MYITVKYEIPVSDFDYIAEGTKLEVIENWSEYEGFIAVKYRQGELYFPLQYFEEIQVVVEVG
jgi:hypothetical protein